VNTLSSLDAKTFQQFVDLIYEKAGISLGPHKKALVSSRLGKRMRTLGIEHFSEYYGYVRDDPGNNELVALLDAISTNVTHFYREPRHFEILKDLVQTWESQGQSCFRLWCAAASTGEEPYTMAMTLQESLRSTWDTKILATDISQNVLQRARAGRYEQDRIQKIPKALIDRYFVKHCATKPLVYEVQDALKRMITFTWLNLSCPPFPMKGPLDVIFCRNVMIYFDNKVRRRLLQEMYRLLRPGGYLMVGHAESLSGMLSHFHSIEPSVYMKSPAK
jgi:chemotaxis protein methyltransferase CheR